MGSDIPDYPPTEYTRYTEIVSHEDEQPKHCRKLSGNPYPLLRVASADLFLYDLEQKLGNSASWRIATNHADNRAVVATYLGDGFPGEGLSVSAYDLDYDRSTPSKVISFATLAHRWFRDGKEVNGVSDEDIATAFRLFLPIVRQACHDCGTRCHIIWPKPEKPKPLPSDTAHHLTSFVRLANLAVLHPFDWERFYRFIRHCHAHRVSLNQGRLRAELVTRGVPHELADELALCYAHGRGVLSCRFEWVE